MKKNLMIGIDVGSGGLKATVVDPAGEVLGSASEEYPTHYPYPGWAEQDPADWRKALASALGRALESTGASSGDVASIAVGAATHTLVVLDERGEPLRPAILWRDKRTIDQVMRLRAEHGPVIFSETLHQANVNWTLPYLVWIRENEPDVWSRIHKLVMPKDYVRFLLTGRIATDLTDAHGTLLFDVINRRWSEKICDLAGLPMEILPEVKSPFDPAGPLTKAAAAEFGLTAGIPVVIGATDQASEAFGSGAVEPGQGLVKLATAGNVAVVSQEPRPVELKVYAYYHVRPELWYILAGTISCAVCFRWFRDAFGHEETTAAARWGLNEYRLLDELAARAPVGSEGLIFHPNLQGAIWDPYLRADFVGATSRHTKEHFARAVLEGVSYSLFSCVQEIDALGVEVRNFRIIGGGARSPLWRRITCDVLGKPLIRPKVDDSSFGTALIGGVGVGLFSGVQEAAKASVRQIEIMEPNQANHEVYRKYFEVYARLQEDMAEAYQRLHRIVEEQGRVAS